MADVYEDCVFCDGEPDDCDCGVVDFDAFDDVKVRMQCLELANSTAAEKIDGVYAVNLDKLLDHAGRLAHFAFNGPGFEFEGDEEAESEVDEPADEAVS